ncbi:hypothetical protein WK65_01110 [Burkholderia ubonensis]|nr:hypothetical protein WK65_01110 [Burkholderia ubonensis]
MAELIPDTPTTRHGDRLAVSVTTRFRWVLVNAGLNDNVSLPVQMTVCAPACSQKPVRATSRNTDANSVLIDERPRAFSVFITTSWLY